MLEKSSFVVKEQSKMFSTRQAYDVLDGESGQPLGSIRPKVSTLWSVLGFALGKDSVPVSFEFHGKADDAVLFAVRRRGFFLPKVEAVDGSGQVIGRFKAKRFSLTGGFHVYDKDGKHFADIKGKMFKADYRFLTPDGKTEVGAVSRTWGGLAKELFSAGSTYGVKLSPAYAGDQATKKLVLGAAVAITALFKKSKGGSGSEGSETSGGGDGE